MLSSPPPVPERELPVRQVKAAPVALGPLLEAAGDIVFALDPAGVIRQASKRALALTATGGELHGVGLATLMADADQPVLRNAIADAAGATDAVRIEARLKTPEKEIWFEFRLAALALPDGAPALLAVGRDMSAQRATEERLRHMARRHWLRQWSMRLRRLLNPFSRESATVRAG
mgnify:CR=1 FL=1